MKKRRFNIKSILFIAFTVFIIWGIASPSVLRPIIGSIPRLIKGEFTVDETKKTINGMVTEELIYHDELMDINSIRENILGTRIIEKDDTIVVKSDEDTLVSMNKLVFNDNTIQKTVDKIKELNEVCEENGVPFLYCAAPNKNYFSTTPPNIKNYSKVNFDRFIEFLSEEGVPCLDLSNVLESIPEENRYFVTDHHWTIYSGFNVAATISGELKNKYGFEYDEKVSDINNYNIKRYEDWFLGSSGKKTGLYFTWKGADDFEYITPKFETKMTEEQPFKNQVRSGSFEETALYTDNLKKDYYKINTYATYGGGDFRLQILKNELCGNNKKILVIRDSFGCAVTPFLSLYTSELHVCDMRDYVDFVGDKVNVEEYIKEIHPDYLIVLYDHLSSSNDSRYNFF